MFWDLCCIIEQQLELKYDNFGDKNVLKILKDITLHTPFFLVLRSPQTEQEIFHLRNPQY